MIDKEKVILMTKLALYDKKEGDADKRANSFFRHDYVYWKNFKARVCALIGCIIIVAVYVLNKIVIEKQDLFDMDYKGEGFKILFFVVVVLGICTFLGSIKATREYSAVQKRIGEHLEITKRLDYLNAMQYDDQSENLPKGDLSANYGADIRNKRGNR